MLWTLVDKGDSMQEQVGDVIRRIEMIRNRQNVLEIQNPVTEMKSVFDGIGSRLQKESPSMRTSQLKSPKLKSKENKDWKKQIQKAEYLGAVGQLGKE